jgi:hypothetical protein
MAWNKGFGFFIRALPLSLKYAWRVFRRNLPPTTCTPEGFCYGNEERREVFHEWVTKHV